MSTTDLSTVRILVEHHLDLLWQHPELASSIPPMLLWGAPGVGKSTIVREVCARRGVGFLDIRLAQREPVDLRGLPVPRGDAVEWLLSAEWPRDPDSKGIILFDELTAADRSLQVAAYELILDRRLGTLYEIPKGWYVMAAGNRTTDRAVARALSSALANRFCHLEVEADLESWVRWAMARGLHPAVIAFLRFRPGLLLDQQGDTERGWPSPRSWERVAVELEHGAALSAATKRVLLEGLVGEPAAREFLGFLSWHDQLPDVLAMLTGEAPISVPPRADQRFALCAAVAHYLWRVPGRNQALRSLFDLADVLGSDFDAMLMVDVLHHRSQEEILAILQHPRFARWTERHGPAFRTRFTTAADERLSSFLGGVV